MQAKFGYEKTGVYREFKGFESNWDLHLCISLPVSLIQVAAATRSQAPSGQATFKRNVFDDPWSSHVGQWQAPTPSTSQRTPPKTWSFFWCNAASQLASWNSKLTNQIEVLLIRLYDFNFFVSRGVRWIDGIMHEYSKILIRKK